MMRRRAEPSGIRLTEADAALVKGMVNRGDRLHDVASYFGVNSARVADVASGKSFSWVVPADSTVLPPPGPYAACRYLADLRAGLEQVAEVLGQLERRLSSPS